LSTPDLSLANFLSLPRQPSRTSLRSLPSAFSSAFLFSLSQHSSLTLQ
jgi:hypothetical protein